MIVKAVALDRELDAYLIRKGEKAFFIDSEVSKGGFAGLLVQSRFFFLRLKISK